MIRKFILFVTAIFLFHFSFAISSDSTRERYIKRFPDYFFIWPVVKQRSTSFDIENLPSKTEKLSYKPNGNYGLGWGMYIFEIGFELTFSIQPKQSTQYLYGHSRVSDLQANVLGKNWGMDLFTQNYNGFYRTDKNITIPPSTPYPQRPDISTWNTGINGIYLFNKNRYSIRAAYNFSEKQIRSGGSFLLSGTLNTFSLRADSAVYGAKYEAQFGTTADFSKLDYTTFSLAPGYAQTFVIKNFFVNTSLSFGPANHWVSYQSAAGSRKEITLNSFIDFRMSVGYNGDCFFSGLSFITQARNIKMDQVQFTSANATFKVVVGYRFKEFGILKKSVRDFVPFVKKDKK
ncbi:MAG TPA: DUF4421 family protein [Cyclobacteriaceae bacterium]|jgi:hypothetical protein|nr:DUF4421 family protein [Cyclobacteriaceae bacterium]